MLFEARSSTEVATGPTGRLVRVGGRARAQTDVEVTPPSLLADGLRIAPQELAPLRLGWAWTPFALTYEVPAEAPREGWLLEVAAPPDPALAAASRALEAVEAVHARIDALEATVARLRGAGARQADLRDETLSAALEPAEAE
jgi:hypothetical protein